MIASIPFFMNSISEKNISRGLRSQLVALVFMQMYKCYTPKGLRRQFEIVGATTATPRGWNGIQKSIELEGTRLIK